MNTAILTPTNTITESYAVKRIFRNGTYILLSLVLSQPNRTKGQLAPCLISLPHSWGAFGVPILLNVTVTSSF